LKDCSKDLFSKVIQKVSTFSQSSQLCWLFFFHLCDKSPSAIVVTIVAAIAAAIAGVRWPL